MTESPKVIEFPKAKIIREVPEEVQVARKAKQDQKFADSVVDELVGMVITELDNYYVDVTSASFQKDYVLFADALKSAVYRQNGIEHHLQDFVDKNIKMLEGITTETSKEEIQEKIDAVIKELMDAKENLDSEDDV